jgi:hypothetical protein
MTVEILLDQLLTQLRANEEAINLIIDFISSNHDNENIKLATLEQIKQNLAKIEINDDNRDIKNILELFAITEAIDEFNNHSKSAQILDQTKKIESTKKREREPSSSSELTVPHNSKKPNLTPSFDSYCSTISTTTASALIQKLSSNIFEFQQSNPKVLDKKKKIDQTSNDTAWWQVSHNAAIFKIENIELDECWCTDSLDRSKENNTRTKMEQNIVKTITEQVKDKTKTIRLVNIGSDKIGLLVILSKLYLLGYKNIDIINLETTDKQSFIDNQKETENYSNLLKTIFSDAAYSYLEVYKQNKTSIDLNKHQISNSAEITVFFAEDLGGLDDKDKNKQYTYNSDYTKTISNAVLLVTNMLKPEEKNLIFYSKHNGDIDKKSMQYTATKPTV